MEVKPGYKQTEVGVIPKDWNSTTLGEFISLQRGHDLTWRDRRDGDVPVMGSAGQNGVHDTALVKGPGVVIGRSGASFGQAHYCETDYWPHNTALFVTDFRGSNPLFVFYFLKALDFSRHNSGGAQQSLNRNFIGQIYIGVPSAEEQRAIAEALANADALLAGLERLIIKKQDLKQAAMQQLLTGQVRLPGFVGEWEVKRLGDVLTICHGKNQEEVAIADGPYPILATGGQIGTASRALYSKPSVLIGRKGTINRPLYMDTPFWTVDTLFYSAMEGDNCAQFFYYRFCLIDWMQFNEASGVPSLNARTIERIEILTPPAVEQAAIAEVLAHIDAELAALEQRREKTLALKQGMMQELLTGKTRLVEQGGSHG